MIEPEHLTQDQFLDELSELLDVLRLEGVDVPLKLEQHVLERLNGSAEEAFREMVFRLAVTHLLEGLDPDMAREEGGTEVLEERLHALPDNLTDALGIAAERQKTPHR